MGRRVFLIVLDSYGIGEAPDADKFGDVGCNTLRSITGSPEYNTPLMKKMGLFNIDGVDVISTRSIVSFFSTNFETSIGKSRWHKRLIKKAMK